MRQFTTVPDNVNTDMVPPSSIVDAFDPDGNGWNGMFPLRNNEFAQTAHLDLELLIRQRWRNCSVLLPKGHWITFGFSEMLVNGLCTDIDCFCLNTNHYPTLFLTDGQTQVYRLDNPKIIPLTNWRRQLEWDLDGLQLPFSPVALRVEGHGRENGNKVVLYQLVAIVNPPN